MIKEDDNGVDVDDVDVDEKTEDGERKIKDVNSHCVEHGSCAAGKSGRGPGYCFPKPDRLEEATDE